MAISPCIATSTVDWTEYEKSRVQSDSQLYHLPFLRSPLMTRPLLGLVSPPAPRLNSSDPPGEPGPAGWAPNVKAAGLCAAGVGAPPPKLKDGPDDEPGAGPGLGAPKLNDGVLPKPPDEPGGVGTPVPGCWEAAAPNENAGAGELAAGAAAPKLKAGLLAGAVVALLPPPKLKAGAAAGVLVAGAAPNGFDTGAGEAAGLATG